MHPFHNHLVAQLREALARGVAVIYDPTQAFQPFVNELGPGEPWSDEHPDVHRIAIGGTAARLVTWEGSWFAVRDAAEAFFAGDRAPDPPLLVYVPAQRPDDTLHVLMELELAGTGVVWDFDKLARECMRKKLTDVEIDKVLGDGKAGYEDVVQFLDQPGAVSKLKALLPGKSENDILVQWLASDQLDPNIETKGAGQELFRLVQVKTGLALVADAKLAQARASLARYLLINEFRHDLAGDPPTTTAGVPSPGTAVQLQNVLDLLAMYRNTDARAYVDRARTVEQEFQLGKAKIQPERLGRIDTFEFEEKLLLQWCAALLADRKYGKALEVIAERESSFWVERTDAEFQMPRKELWELCRRVGELGRRIAAVRADLPAATAGAEEWVARYTNPDGWHRMDAAQRELETWHSRIAEDDTALKAVDIALRDHDALLHTLAVGFTHALKRAGWTVPGVLHQTRVHPDVVATRSGPVAWFLVDAFRFEMGAELARQIEGAEELQLRPAIAALPSITPVGMAALLPGASTDFAVMSHKGGIAARVDGNIVATLADRQKHVQARVPDSADMTLGRVLQDKPGELKKRVAGKGLVVVRSTEIDQMGESSDDMLARQAMETVIGNLARAARRLSAAGIEQFVVTADHGHLFGERKQDDMKIDPPGGDTVDLHRRCWIGRGGATPAATNRVKAIELGYASDLDFVFPAGLGVFKAGGDLSFHHGSTSLQELVIPVLSFRLPAAKAEEAAGGVNVEFVTLPEKVTNGVFIVGIRLAGLLATESIELRVILTSEKDQVGQVGMASGCHWDRANGLITVAPGAVAQLGMRLADDHVESLKVVVLDPATGAQLASSGAIPVRLMR